MNPLDQMSLKICTLVQIFSIYSNMQRVIYSYIYHPFDILWIRVQPGTGGRDPMKMRAS